MGFSAFWRLQGSFEEKLKEVLKASGGLKGRLKGVLGCSALNPKPYIGRFHWAHLSFGRRVYGVGLSGLRRVLSVFGVLGCALNPKPELRGVVL